VKKRLEAEELGGWLLDRRAAGWLVRFDESLGSRPAHKIISLSRRIAAASFSLPTSFSLPPPSPTQWQQHPALGGTYVSSSEQACRTGSWIDQFAGDLPGLQPFLSGLQTGEQFAGQPCFPSRTLYHAYIGNAQREEAALAIKPHRPVLTARPTN